MQKNGGSPEHKDNEKTLSPEPLQISVSKFLILSPSLCLSRNPSASLVFCLFPLCSLPSLPIPFATLLTFSRVWQFAHGPGAPEQGDKKQEIKMPKGDTTPSPPERPKSVFDEVEAQWGALLDVIGCHNDVAEIQERTLLSKEPFEPLRPIVTHTAVKQSPAPIKIGS